MVVRRIVVGYIVPTMCSDLECGDKVGLSCDMLGYGQRRLQSSPRRIFCFPSDPVCSMLKAIAIMGSG